MKELKPCPFCGGEAKVDKVWWWEEWEHYIYCSQCHVTQARDKDEEQAIEAWNKRANLK